MRRRALLATVGAGALGGLAGCADIQEVTVELSGSELENCLDRELDGTHAPGVATDRDVSIGVNNETTASWTTAVRVARDGETIVDETVTTEEAAFAAVSDGEITETGDYQLSVDVDGGDTVAVTWRVCVDSFILVVVIGEGGAVRFRKREAEYEE